MLELARKTVQHHDNIKEGSYQNISFSDGYSQKKSKAQLEKEKKESLQKIAQAEKILSQTSSKRKNSIGELYAIQQQIKDNCLSICPIKFISIFNTKFILIKLYLMILNTQPISI